MQNFLRDGSKAGHRIEEFHSLLGGDGEFRDIFQTSLGKYLSKRELRIFGPVFPDIPLFLKSLAEPVGNGGGIGHEGDDRSARDTCRFPHDVRELRSAEMLQHAAGPHAIAGIVLQRDGGEDVRMDEGAGETEFLKEALGEILAIVTEVQQEHLPPLEGQDDGKGPGPAPEFQAGLAFFCGCKELFQPWRGYPQKHGGEPLRILGGDHSLVPAGCRKVCGIFPCPTFRERVNRRGWAFAPGWPSWQAARAPGDEAPRRTGVVRQSAVTDGWRVGFCGS